MGFTEHARKTATRAGSTANNLARIMPNISAARAGRRWLLAGVVHSRLFYGLEVWSDRMSKQGWTELEKVQRKGALGVTSAYCTVSKDAVLVVEYPLLI